MITLTKETKGFIREIGLKESLDLACEKDILILEKALDAYNKLMFERQVCVSCKPHLPCDKHKHGMEDCGKDDCLDCLRHRERN